MFRKIVSNLNFSPALVGQLGFYARRLKKEQFTRRLGLILTAFVVVAQSFAVFSPPEQALASSGSDIIKGGVSSVKNILNVYDNGARGRNDFKDLMDYFGITRKEIASMKTKVVYVCSKDKSIVSFGRKHHYSASQGEVLHRVPRSTGGYSKFYSVPLHRFDSVNNRINCYDSYVGYSAKVGWFAIMRKCGNLQIKKNVRKVPQGQFISASCRTIQGFAYDERQLDLKVRVYLFFGGPPGKGAKYGPILANNSSPNSPAGRGYGFNFAVPAKYQKSNKATPVWGVLVPLAGWHQNTVQFKNVVYIPPNCTPQPASVVCTTLKLIKVDRDRIKLVAAARTQNGGLVKDYKFSIKGNNTTLNRTVATTALSASTDTIQLEPGTYNASVVITATKGTVTSLDCALPLTVTPPERCPYNPNIIASDEDCKPCPYSPSLWLKDNRCEPHITLSKEAKNFSQNNLDAENTTAKPNDRIEFTIRTTNLSAAPADFEIKESLEDVLEYSRLVEQGGGRFDRDSQELSWGTVRLAAGKTDVRSFIVEVLPEIKATPRGANNPAAYNCVMTNAYGNTIDIMVNCPIEKEIEAAVKTLPQTGPGENMIFSGVALTTVTYFYARSRQTNKEIKKIKKEFSTGTL